MRNVCISQIYTCKEIIEFKMSKGKWDVYFKDIFENREGLHELLPDILKIL